MRKLFLFILISLFFVPLCSAVNSVDKYGTSMKQGSFKKNWHGNIVQYDKNGKKIGEYKFNKGKYVRVK